jgi:branched-subunit amino acid aminotransferase/4-amino-4-deoxychorismate lyase
VAEAATGSILARTDGEWWAPVSQYQLPGVTLRQIVYQIYDSGMDVKFRPASPAELASAQTVWILNSLVGVMPVSYLDGYPLEDPAAEEAAAFREVYFRQDLPQAL